MHYGCGDAEQILPPVIREVNAMDPRPSFFGIAGDLICKGSLCFGQVPDEQQQKEAIEEFKAPKRHLQLLDPSIPIKPEHKMSVADAKLEVEAEGFKLTKTNEDLPRQHILIFTKAS